MTVNDYMRLEYPHEVISLPADEGGSVYVRCPDFGAAAAQGDGATLEAALAEANEAKRLTIEVLLEDGRDVEPLLISSGSVR